MTATTPLGPLGVSALALLVEREMHPYEMYQLMLERRGDRVVKVTAGSLYRAVERLAADGLIRSTVVERQGNRPERTVYAITGAGHAALAATLESMLARTAQEYPEFPLALGEAHNLPATRVAELLAERRTAVQQLVDLFDHAIEVTTAKGLDRRFVLNLPYSRRLHAAELEWLDETIAELASGALDWAAPSIPDAALVEASAATSAASPPV